MASITIGNPTFIAPAVLSYSKTAKAAQDSTARLVGGNRILRPGDDSGTFAIATQLQAQSLRYRQSTQDLTRTDTLINVAKEKAGAIKDALEQAAELAEQAADDETIDTNRLFLQQQLTGILEEIDTLAAETSFDGQQLLDGSFSDVDIRVGPEDTDFINLSISNVDTDTLFSGSLPDISSEASAATAVTDIEDAIETVGNIEANLAGIQAALFSAKGNGENIQVRVEDARSGLADTNIDEELRSLAKTQIQLDVGAAVIAQARRLPNQLLTVLDFRIENAVQPEEDDAAEEPAAEPITQSSNSTGVNASLSADAA